MDAENGTWNGYCCMCGGFGHRADSCRWNRIRLARVFALSQSMKTDLQLTPLGTLEGFKEGTGTEHGAHTLAAAVNLAAVLSRDLTDHEKRIAAEGLEAVRGVFKRGNAAGKWGCSGDEYRAIGAALALGAELADSTNRRTVAAAIKTVFQEVGR